MWEPRENEKLSPAGENCPEIWRVIARTDRRTIVETVMAENASLGAVDPQLDRLAVMSLCKVHHFLTLSLTN